jgi:thiamine-phosphate pyrophosphorylase
MNPALRGLYAITDPVLTPPSTLIAQVAAALRGGARIIQLRDKSNDFEQRLQLARRLRDLTREHGAILIINDDVEICLEAEADGVHLGQDDMSLSMARAALGPDFIIGATCHGSLELAQQALEESADYLAFGRFFPSRTKPDAPPAALPEIADFIARCPVAAVAIGGITLNNAAPLLDAGFAMLAVVNDVFGHQDIEGQCRRYSQLFKDSP